MAAVEPGSPPRAPKMHIDSQLARKVYPVGATRRRRRRLMRCAPANRRGGVFLDVTRFKARDIRHREKQAKQPPFLVAPLMAGPAGWCIQMMDDSWTTHAGPITLQLEHKTMARNSSPSPCLRPPETCLSLAMCPRPQRNRPTCSAHTHTHTQITPVSNTPRS